MEAHEANADTPVTTVPRVCPICLKLIRSDAPAEDVLEFFDFPGVTYHVTCAERIGVGRVRDILAQNWPPPPRATEASEETPEDGAEEASDTETDEPAASDAAA